MSKIKNELSYSEMTDKVYWNNGRGERKDVSDQFQFVLGLMAKRWKGFKFNMQNKENPEDGFSVEVKAVPYEEVKEEEKEKENGDG